MAQMSLFDLPTKEAIEENLSRQWRVKPFKTQLLKWIGNKQRFAHEIASFFPDDIGTYYEPFLGSAAVLGTLQPIKAFASDAFSPLATIWITLHDEPELLKEWYCARYEIMASKDKIEAYEEIKASYNANPNAADLLYLCRTCYGGVVRFRKADGYMSTPCGVHNPVTPESFSSRVDLWHLRTKGATFANIDYQDAMALATAGDLVYCDPPYSDSQSILYGAQSFSLTRLLEVIVECKERGVYVALSIDGKKKSGAKLCDLPLPDGLFEREVFVNCGPSMLKRFQMEGRSCEDHIVADRLLLTY